MCLCILVPWWMCCKFQLRVQPAGFCRTDCANHDSQGQGNGQKHRRTWKKHGNNARSLQKSSLSGWNLESEDRAKMCHTNLVNIQGAIMCQPQALTRPQWSVDESGWLVTVAALEVTSDVRRWRDNTKICLRSRIPADFHRAFRFEHGRVNAP